MLHRVFLLPLKKWKNRTSGIKNWPACNARRPQRADSIPGLGRSHQEGNGNPLQYSCLKNPKDRGAWQATVYGAAESDMTEAIWHIQFSSVAQSCLTVTPWTAARQASLSITNSWSLLKLVSIESVMWSNHLILYRPLLLLPSVFPSLYQWVSSLHQVAKDLAHTSWLFWGLNKILCMKFLAQFWVVHKNSLLIIEEGGKG